MATVTGLTAERMQEIIDATVVGAHITGDDLILELFDATEINAGDVRGPIGLTGPSGDPGDIKSTIRSSAQPGWLMLDGTSHLNANVEYPDLWAIVPAAWKSGTTLLLPNMTDAVLMGGGVLGTLAGTNSRTLVTANLPIHAHTIAHTHEHVHTHTITHDHANTTATASGSHAHEVSMRANPDGTTAPAGGQGTILGTGGTTSTDGSHTHPVDIPTFTGSSGAASDATTGGSSAANSGNAGSGTPLDITPKNLRVNYIIKT